jgi:hypothetical protein
VKGDHRNIFVGGTLAVGVGLLIVFLALLLDSSQGEAASALGSVIGGAIGAGGAGYSVYYSMTRQREDETQKVSKAVLAEMAVIVKYVIGHLNLCEMIVSGFHLPKTELRTALLTPEPIVYRAVADKISRLPRPIQVINFYTRMAEVDGIVTVIINSPTIGSTIDPEHIHGLADLLITQCHDAQAILKNATPDETAESVIAERLRLQTIAAIEQQLQQAKLSFPNSEAFR